MTLPLRAVSLFHEDKFGLSSQASERFDYVAREVSGYCLDVGCGPRNRFVTEYLNGNGRGIDVYPYEGLAQEHLVHDLTHFPFEDESFKSVTFIASLNHCPRKQRDVELAEACRVLKPGGNIIITMGNPVAEVLVHQIVRIYDRLLGTKLDLDNERGMHAEENYYIRDSEIINRLARAGFEDIRKKYFVTQWGLNHLFAAWRR